MTTGAPKPSNVAIAALIVDADHGVIQVNDALVDTGGSKNVDNLVNPQYVTIGD